MITIITRAVAVKAGKGESRSARIFLAEFNRAESETRETRRMMRRAILNYNAEWETELHRRELLGIDGPEPIPHPDEIVTDPRTGEVHIVGPSNADQKEILEVAITLIPGLVKALKVLESKLKQQTNEGARKKLAEEISDAKRNITKLEMSAKPMAARVANFKLRMYGIIDDD